MERLTARNQEGLAYLLKVKPNEQDVESPYPNTLRCIMESFNRLAAYEDTGLEPEEILDPVEMAKVAIALKENTRLREQLAERDKEIDRVLEVHKKEVIVTGEYAQRAIDLKAETARLREQLTEVTVERDEAVALIASLVDLCSVPQADQSKVFRRLVFGAGDYMGSGYAFIDAFYRIWDEFEENATEPLYRSIRAALDGLWKEPDNAND